MTLRQLLLSILGITTIFFLFCIPTSCTYHNEEELYTIEPCDTTNVTYSENINAILSNKCNACHSKSSALGGVVTENYDDLKTIVNDGRFWGTINHLKGYEKMPKGLNKLSDCELKKIEIWMDNGAPKN